MTTKPSTIEDAIKVIEAKDMRIAKLEAQMKRFNRQVFGKRSEKIVQDNAIDVFTGEQQCAATQNATTIIPLHARKTTGHGWNEIPEGLPTEIVEALPPEGERQCPECKTEKCACGYESSRKLVRRTEFLVQKTRRIKLVCKAHPEAGVSVAKPPAAYIPKGIADETVIAHVVTDKYLDHLPLDRQERRFARQDISIGKSTMVGWALMGRVQLQRYAGATGAAELSGQMKRLSP